MPSQLVERVRAKYPGAYDDLDDAALEKAVLAKYPEYRDLVEPKPDFRMEVRASDSAPGFVDQALGVVGDLGVGALKGAGQTATNLGQAIHMIPGVSRAVDTLYGAPVSQPSFAEADKVLTPTNTAQTIGKGAEQIAEFFVPGGAVKRAAQGVGLAGRAALEGAAGAGVAAAQGASPLEIGVSGVLAGAPTAALPYGRKLTATMAEHLRAKAAKRVTEGLGATTKRLKNEAQRIAPEFAERGLGGSIEHLAEQSTAQVDDLGRQIGAAMKGPIGQETRATAPIVAQLEKAKSKLTTKQVGPSEGVTGYHGSPKDFDKFDISKAGTATDEGFLGRALYFSSDDAVIKSGQTGYRANLGIKNPLKIEATEWGADKKAIVTKALGLSPKSTADEITAKAKSLGYDSVALDYSKLGYNHKEYAVFSDDIVRVVGKSTDRSILRQLEDAKQIVTDKPQYEALAKLQDVVREYGDEMSVAQINALKKIYARVTSRSGGYNEKAGEILHTAPEAAKTFAAILRKEENGVEALQKLNQEFRFWKSLQNVTKATVDRRSSQGKGLTAAMAPVIGAASGAASGEGLADRAQNALIGGVMGRQVTKALQSPQWKFVRARYAEKLAQALAHRDPERVGNVVGKILAAEAAHVN